MYAFPLSSLTANIEDPENPEHLSITISPSFQNIRKGDLATVLLKNLNGKIVYQITFDIKEDKKIADCFFSLVQQTVEEGKDPAGKVRCHRVLPHSHSFLLGWPFFHWNSPDVELKSVCPIIHAQTSSVAYANAVALSKEK